ncbi:MAG TPA: histidine phosphatase family protein [Chloroflexota bacterium]|nr:histidine phosphatase family protein [Chloroflexota bacterium]HUM71909.1 histidine phosphatase family protein [Chloroflexota bacterium]
MIKVWFIRHGESVSNADLPTIHPAESELTPRGHEEAALIAQAFAETPDLIVVSSYVRAKETAVPTQMRFPHVPVETWPVYEFSYLHPERYSGTTGSQRGPFAQAYWERNDPWEEEGGDGESFAALLARVQETRTRLQEQSAEFVAVFSHGLFLRALLWSALTGITTATPEAMKRYHRFIHGVWMPNGAIMEALFMADGRLFFSGFRTAHM